MLHITNGDAAGLKLQRAGVPGIVLAWRDVLHEGRDCVIDVASGGRVGLTGRGRVTC